MIRQPIVYKPSNPRYLDAYTEKLNLEKKEAAKLQREREKERKAEQDKLGMYTNRKYASPVHQRAYDTYIKDFNAKAVNDPDKFSFFLNETIPLIESLDAENKSVSTMYNEAIKSVDYRNKEEFENAFMANDGGEDFDAYNRGGVMTKALDPFNKLQKSFNLNGYVSNEGNAILKNLARDPKTLSRYFNRDIREKDLDDMTMTEIFTSIKPEAVEEVMEIILSSNPEAISQAEFDYSRGIENEQEKRDNAIKMVTQDLGKFLGMSTISKVLKKGEGDRERRGGGTTIDLNVDISEEDTTGTYEDSKAQGVGHFRDVKLSGLDTYVGGDFTYKDEDGNQTRAKIKSLEMGKQGVNLGKPVAVLEISSEGKGGVKLVDKLFSEIKGELLNQVKYTGEKKDGIVGKIKEWEVEANKQAEAGKFDEKEILSYIDDAAKIWKGGGSKEERLAKIKEFLGRDDIESVFGLDDIKIGGERINFDDDTYSDDEMAIIWESKSKKPSSYKGGQETREEKKARLIKEASEAVIK